MPLHVVTDTNMSFKLLPALPKDYRGPLLAGGKVSALMGRAGSVLLQELQEAEYSLQYAEYFFLEPMELKATFSLASIQTLLALKNNMRYRVDGLGSFHLREGQFVILHAPGSVVSMQLEKDKEYQVFALSCSGEWLEELLPYFPRLLAFFGRMDKGKSILLDKATRYAGNQARDIVHHVLRAPYEDKLRQYYFENMVRDYLFLLLAETYESHPKKIKLSEAEKERLYEIHDIVTTRINERFPIPVLAKMTLMNEFKLKAGFRQLFGMGIFEKQMASRMEVARRLLLKTDKPVKEIAAITCYQSLTSFVTRFRKHFGYSTTSVRKNS